MCDRAHALDGGQPLMRGGVDSFSICGFLGGGHLHQCIRFPCSEGRVSWQAPFRFCGLDPGFGPLRDQGALELSNSAEHLERKHALRRRCIDGVAQGPEMRTLLRELLDDVKEMADRACQSVEPDYDQRLATGDIIEQLRKGRAGAGCAGAMLFDNQIAARGSVPSPALSSPGRRSRRAHNRSSGHEEQVSSRSVSSEEIEKNRIDIEVLTAGFHFLQHSGSTRASGRLMPIDA